MLNKSTKNTQGRRGNLVSSYFWGNWIFTCKIMKLDMLCIKINMKWIKDLNIGPEKAKLLQGNRRTVS